MTPKSSVRILILSLFALSALAAKRPPCKDICRFKRCSSYTGEVITGLGRINFPPANTGFIKTSPVVCEKGADDSVGYVLKTGEPILETREGVDVPLKSWNPPGLSDRFPKKFFFLANINKFRRSGITRKPVLGNQLEMLTDLCVRLPVLSYEKVKKKDRSVKKVIKTKKKDESACVSFRAFASHVLVQLQWEGRDDLDLTVTQPDGQKLDRFNLVTTGGEGRFFEEGGSDNCFGGVDIGREGVIYPFKNGEPVVGTYKVEIRHFNNCGTGPTPWELSVLVAGKVVIIDRGESDGTFSEVVYSKTFEVGR